MKIVGESQSTEEPVELEEESGGELEEETAEQETEEAKQSEELKVVIIINDNGAMLGVQATDCDPVYKTLKGDLAAALKQVPKLVEEAKQKWDTNPRYPKAVMPEPPPSPSPSPARTTVATRSRPAQPSFF